MATTLTGLVTPLTTASYNVASDLTLISSEVGQLNDQINPQGSKELVCVPNGQTSPLVPNSISTLIQSDGSALDFSGLGAQAFQESLKVHLDVTGNVTAAFDGASKALTTFGNAVDALNSQYDGQLNTIKGTDYAPGWPWNDITQGARDAFYNLDPYTVMIDDVIAGASGNAVLTNGSSDLLNALSSAYVHLANQAEGAYIYLPTPEDIPTNQAQARQMVVDALDGLYYEIYQAYNSWASGVQQAFQTFTSSMSTVEQTVQPYIDILTQPTSAASIFDMIHMISGSDQPMAIVQTGPNSILVMISGTNLSDINYDTNLWNALGTGMGQNMPYEQDVIDAINQYCQEHGLTNPEVMLAGHSLGGMVAQQVADAGLFDVTQVVTYGSPVMGPPQAGVNYNIYEADSDLVPLLSRYENYTLPANLQELAKKFPAQFGGGGNPIRDIIGANEDAPGVGYLLSEVMDLSPFMSPTDQKAIMNQKLGPVTVQDLTGMFSNFQMQPYAGNQTKLQFMDPSNAYQGQVQRVPDLPESLGLKVHSDYGQSQWLEQQNVFWNMNTPTSNFLDNVEYFGMPNEGQTAQINQYMQQHSTVGEYLH
jgi:hypothetical protein